MKPTHDLDPVDDHEAWGSLQGLALIDDSIDYNSKSENNKESPGGVFFPAPRNVMGGSSALDPLYTPSESLPLKNQDISEYQENWLQDTIDDFKEKKSKKPPTPPPTPVLPGSGDPGRHCGERRNNTCTHCGKLFVSTYHCCTRLCPSCYKKWASKEARVASEFIQEFRKGYKIGHVQISFPGQPEDIWKLRSRVYKIAKIHGGYGGSCVPHPWRWDELTEAWIHDGYIHYHLIVLFGPEGFKTVPDVQKEDADRNGGCIRGKYDYVFKVLKQHRSDGNFSWWVAIRDLKRRIYYQLEHCGLADSRNAITWWGFLNQQPALKKTKKRIKKKDAQHHNKCKHCGSLDTIPGSVIDPREVISDKDLADGTYSLHYCPIEPRKKINILDYEDEYGEWIV